MIRIIARDLPSSANSQQNDPPYLLLAQLTATELTQQVNEALAGGYRLYGPPFYGGQVYCQAVVLPGVVT